MKWYRTLALIQSLVILALTGYIFIQSARQEADNCPKIVSARQLSLPRTLYYLKNEEAVAVWAHRHDTHYATDLVITPWSHFVISPDGERLLHAAIPVGNTADGDNYPGQFSLIQLPLVPAGSGENQEKTISYRSAWPAFRAGPTWIDASTFYFNAYDNRSIVFNISDDTYEEITWHQPSDMWENDLWGAAIRSEDLRYIVYPDSTLKEGLPNPGTGEAVLKLLDTSDPTFSYRLLSGYVGSIEWQGNQFIVFQASDNKWYRLDVTEVLQAGAGFYSGQGLTLFHEGIRTQLDLPAISPNGHLLAAGLYLPDEQASTLLLLSDEESSYKDTCVHGHYEFQMIYPNAVSSVWSPDSRYIAFIVNTDEWKYTRLYVYDTVDDTLAEVDRTGSTGALVIIGWGS
jgi:hypothetical protein